MTKRNILFFHTGTPIGGVVFVCKKCKTKFNKGEAVILIKTGNGDLFLGTKKKIPCPKCGLTKNGVGPRVFKTFDDSIPVLKYWKQKFNQGNLGGLCVSDFHQPNPKHPCWF